MRARGPADPGCGSPPPWARRGHEPGTERAPGAPLIAVGAWCRLERGVVGVAGDHMCIRAGLKRGGVPCRWYAVSENHARDDQSGSRRAAASRMGHDLFQGMMEHWTLLAVARGLISAAAALGTWAVVESTAGVGGRVTDLLVMDLTSLVLAEVLAQGPQLAPLVGPAVGFRAGRRASSAMSRGLGGHLRLGRDVELRVHFSRQRGVSCALPLPVVREFRQGAERRPSCMGLCGLEPA